MYKFYIAEANSGSIGRELTEREKKSLVQAHLSRIVTEIEYFKLINGTYPKSLREQRQFSNQTGMYLDDLYNEKKCNNEYYYFYIKKNNKYILRSVGSDNKIFTKDDVLPSVAYKFIDKLGLVVTKEEGVKYPEVVCYEMYKS